MTHVIPKPVADSLRALYLAYQHDVTLVTNMLGIPEGATYNIDFDKGIIEVPDQPLPAIDAQEGVGAQ